MTEFKSLSDNAEFVKLNSKRGAALVELTHMKKSLEKASKEKLSARSFQRIEARIDSKVEQLEAANEAVSSFFSKMGGNPLEDSDFDTYYDTATTLTGEIEILREAYYDLLNTKGLLKPEPTATPELLDILKTLSDAQKVSADAQKVSAETQKSAIETQK